MIQFSKAMFKLMEGTQVSHFFSFFFFYPPIPRNFENERFCFLLFLHVAIILLLILVIFVEISCISISPYLSAMLVLIGSALFLMLIRLMVLFLKRPPKMCVNQFR